MELGELPLRWCHRISNESGHIRVIEADVDWIELRFAPSSGTPKAVEDANLGAVITRMVLAQIGALWRATDATGLEYRFSVLLHPLFVGQFGFVSGLNQFLDELNLPPERLEIRLAASLLDAHSEPIRAAFRALDLLDIQVCIEPSAPTPDLADLVENLPFHLLKIGPISVGQRNGWDGHLDFFRAIILGAERQNIQLSAVGVTERNHFRALNGLGLHFSQGPVLASDKLHAEPLKLAGHRHPKFPRPRNRGRAAPATSPFERSSLNPPPKILPLLPKTLVHLLSIPSDKKARDVLLLELGHADPVLAAILLSNAANTFSDKTPTALNLPQAIVRLGTKSITAGFREGTQAEVFIPSANHLLWTHSLQTAYWAAGLCRIVPDMETPSSTAYLAGLLHDFGRFAMLLKTPDKLAQVERTGWKDVEQLLRQEHRVFHFDHAEVGAALAKLWSLPKNLQYVIAKHHTVLSRPEQQNPLGKLTQIVQLADRLSVGMLHHPEMVDWPAENFSNFQDPIREKLDILWRPNHNTLVQLCRHVHEGTKKRAGYIGVPYAKSTPK